MIQLQRYFIADDHLINTLHKTRMVYNVETKKIGLLMLGYENFYEVIRGLNHEELHRILHRLIGYNTCDEFDNLMHHPSGFEQFNSKFREELYELQNKQTKQISKKELTQT